VDIEGSEYDMFDSMPDDVLCSIPKMAGEFHNIMPEKRWMSIIERLRNLGYEIWIEEYTNNTARFFAWREKNDKKKKVEKFKQKRQLKILQVQPGNIPIERKEGGGQWGAIEKIIWEYKKALEKRGHIVHFMNIDDTIKKYKDYDIVHCHMADLSLRLNQEKISYVNHIHDHHLEIYLKNSRCYHNNKSALDNSIFSLVPGEHMIDYFEHHPKLHFLPHGVDLDYYKPDKTKHNTTSILCVGNNSIGGSDGITSFDRKGFHHAIKAAKMLGLPVIIAGPRNWNEQFFKDMPYDYDKVKVIYDPSDAELLELYQGRNILVHASSVECGHPPLTILEGMACSLPTIATFMGKGVIHPDLEIKRKPSMIADAIQKVLDNYWYYSEWSDKVSSEFSWKRVCNELEELYEKSLL
jgi:glycosyltransferase involved in cell wall biosynthesis